MNAPQINVTPLIDVLLVLLIIFMIVSPLKPAKFETKIPREPKKEDRNLIANADTLVVIIHPNETLSINRDYDYSGLDKLPALTKDLVDIFKSRSLSDADQTRSIAEDRRKVFIKAPRSTSYGKIVRVIDAVKLGGADPMGLQIDDLVE